MIGEATDQLRNDALHRMRTAIDAMRESTEGRLPATVLTAWRAVIDAALDDA